MAEAVDHFRQAMQCLRPEHEVHERRAARDRAGSDDEVKRSSGWLFLLWPLSLLYMSIARAKSWCYARGIFRRRKLPGTVIGVGNLTVGGTGKTPMVLAIRCPSPKAKLSLT